MLFLFTVSFVIYFAFKPFCLTLADIDKLKYPSAKGQKGLHHLSSVEIQSGLRARTTFGQVNGSKSLGFGPSITFDDETLALLNDFTEFVKDTYRQGEYTLLEMQALPPVRCDNSVSVSY